MDPLTLEYDPTTGNYIGTTQDGKEYVVDGNRVAEEGDEGWDTSMDGVRPAGEGE